MSTPTRRGKLDPMIESRLESRFRSAVRRAGGRVVKLAPTEKGVPDRLVLLPDGRTELVELKTETGRLSPAQRLWRDRAAEIGVRVHVLYGADDIDHWVQSNAAKAASPL